jgi:DUF971 family protein
VTQQRDPINSASPGDGDGSATAVAVPPAGSPTAPLRMHADRTARTFAIDWADGHASVYDFAAMRWLCPCAYCRGEAGLPGWLDSAPTLTDEQTRMIDVHLVGNYAVSPHWGDGHSTGFYTFSLLRDRCPCPECTARRNQTGHGNATGHQHD